MDPYDTRAVSMVLSPWQRCCRPHPRPLPQRLQSARRRPPDAANHAAAPCGTVRGHVTSDRRASPRRQGEHTLQPAGPDARMPGLKKVQGRQRQPVLSRRAGRTWHLEDVVNGIGCRRALRRDGRPSAAGCLLLPVKHTGRVQMRGHGLWKALQRQSPLVPGKRLDPWSAC